MRIEEMRIVLMFGAGSRAIFEGQPGKILWSLYSPKGDLIDQRNVDPKHMRMSVIGLLTMCDVAEAAPQERDPARQDDRWSADMEDAPGIASPEAAAPEGEPS